MTAWGDRLAEAVRAKQSVLVVGIDPRIESLPEPLQQQAAEGLASAASAFSTFGKEVIDAVAEYTGVVKPQAAFFEQLGPHGMTALAEVVDHARERGLLVLMDAKRNDIGSTAEGYARAYLGDESPWRCDALTVSPYLGEDSLRPFQSVCRERDAGIFVLVKTSNPGGGLFQDLSANGQRVYEHVGALVESMAADSAGESGYGSVGAVVGATYPEQLEQLRQHMPHAWLLIPGFGAQGGSAEDVAAAFDDKGLGGIVNSSRGVIFAYRNEQFAAQAKAGWQHAVAAAAQDARDRLNTVR